MPNLTLREILALPREERETAMLAIESAHCQGGSMCDSGCPLHIGASCLISENNWLLDVLNAYGAFEREAGRREGIAQAADYLRGQAWMEQDFFVDAAHALESHYGLPELQAADLVEEMGGDE